MSEAYYKYRKPQAKYGGEGLTQEIFLSAIEGDGRNNALTIEIATTYQEQIVAARISLDEKEQDKLITEILKRRGIIIDADNPEFQRLNIEMQEPLSAIEK